MIANSALLVAMVLVLVLFWLPGALSFLAPYRHVLLRDYFWPLVGATLVVFINLFALFYAVSRILFLKDTGRKLAHVDRQLTTTDTVVQDLSDRLARED